MENLQWKYFIEPLQAHEEEYFRIINRLKAHADH